MSLRNFKVEKYLKDGETTYGQRENIEKMADALTERGYDNVVAIGIGGTWAEWYPVVHYMKHKTDLPVYLCNAAELLVRKDRDFLTKNSLVVTASASGDTKEILQAVQMCKDEGIEVCGFTKNAETPLAKLLDKAVYNACGDCEDSYLMYFMFGLRLLYKREEFDEYEEWADQMKNLHKNLLRFREEFEPEAASIAKKYARQPYNIFVGSVFRHESSVMIIDHRSLGVFLPFSDIERRNVFNQVFEPHGTDKSRDYAKDHKDSEYRQKDLSGSVSDQGFAVF